MIGEHLADRVVLELLDGPAALTRYDRHVDDQRRRRRGRGGAAAKALGASDAMIAPDTSTDAATAILVQPILGMPRSRFPRGPAAIVWVALPTHIGHLPRYRPTVCEVA